MARYRIIPTSLTNPNDIARALREMGLGVVEVHSTAQPLEDWIGRPTDVLANVIVRRKSIGASSDDLGFVRNERGTYDALLSDIHLFRFDRKWLVDLASRCGVEIPPASFETTAYVPQRKIPAPPLPPEHKNPGQPLKIPPVRPPPQPNVSSATATATKPQSAASPAPPDTVASGAPPSTLFGAGHVERAQHDTAAIVERLHGTTKKSGASCLLFFVPVPIWIFISSASGSKPDVGVLIALWVVWTFIVVIVLGVMAASRLQSRAREFARRFPSDAKDRAVAMAHLEAIADMKQSPLATTATSLLREIRKSAGSRATPNRAPTRRG